MFIFNGIAASGGYASGEAICLQTPHINREKTLIKDIPSEVSRLHTAIKVASEALGALYKRAVELVDEKTAEIFSMHAMMLTDQDYIDRMVEIIKDEGICAEYAVNEASKQFEEMLEGTGDDYMRERAADVRDICTRLLCQLTNQESTTLKDIDRPVVIVACEIMPSQTVNLDLSKVLAFVTCKGSDVSHGAILARSLGIPAVVGIGEGWKEIKNGDPVTVDGCTGRVCVNPDEMEYRKFTLLREEFAHKKAGLTIFKDKESISRDGVKVEIGANIGCPGEVEAALSQSAEGVGLFRTEFLFMENSDFPTEEQQFAAYKETLQRMSDKRVIIRTLDLGADKPVPYLALSKEENPAMGYRAIRICLDRPDIFLPQLRALLRASVYGKLGIMFPMITSVDEVLRIKEIICETKLRLTDEGKPWSNQIEYGIMVETPAAVMMSDRLAEHVDFFSIGTNDLTQYMLALDRVNEKVHYLFNPAHPAVLRAIKLVAKNAHEHGIWVGICGESAANTALTAQYLAMGIDELSVSPSSVLEVRKAVCESTVKATTIDY